MAVYLLHMGYLGSVLKVQLEKRGWPAAEISRKTGLQQSWLSRIIRGQQTSTEHDDFIAVLRCFGKDERGHPTPADQAQIIAARLMDHRIGPGAELVKVSVQSESGSASRPVKTPKISPEEDRALEFLRLSPYRDKIRPMIIILAKTFGMPEEPPT
jgi:transcriptional regulator with XRE-family HTH domain